MEINLMIEAQAGVDWPVWQRLVRADIERDERPAGRLGDGGDGYLGGGGRRHGAAQRRQRLDEADGADERGPERHLGPLADERLGGGGQGRRATLQRQRLGLLPLGHAESTITAHYDPLEDLPAW